MPVSISIPKRFLNLEGLVDDAIEDSFKTIAEYAIKLMKDRSPVFTEQYKNGFGYRIVGAGFNSVLTIYNSSPDAQFVEEGRKPGKQPPPDVMLAWVAFKHLANDEGFGLGARRPNLMSSMMRQQIQKRTIKIEAPANELSQMKSIAFLIGRAIGQRGLPGFHLFGWVRDDPDRIMEWTLGQPIRTIAKLFETNIKNQINSAS